MSYSSIYRRPSREYVRHKYSLPPQFTIDDMFISPFDARKDFQPNGQWTWQPLERNLSPTGVDMLDELLRYFAAGHYDRKPFYKRYGITTGHNKLVNPLYGFVRVLTGMDIRELHNRFALRTADLLLQYTDMKAQEIARRSGSFSSSTLASLYKKYYNCGTVDRRAFLRSQGDTVVGCYRLVPGVNK